MKIALNALPNALKQAIKPFYVLAGDEVLLMQEAIELIKAQAKQFNYDETVVVYVDKQFDWEGFAADCSTPSLFASKRLFDLRLTTSKLTKTAAQVLIDIATPISANTTLIISAKEWKRADAKSKWCQTLMKDGLMIDIWPIKSNQYIQWLSNRMRAKGLTITQEGLSLLAQQTEGNLVAAVQQINMLALIYGKQQITLDAVEQVISDQSSFDGYTLLDAIYAGNCSRALTILRRIKSENNIINLILFLIAKEIRLFSQLSGQEMNGQQVKSIFSVASVWQSKQAVLYKVAQRKPQETWFDLLSRCMHIDCIAKGQATGEPWHLLEKIIVDAC